MDGNHQQGEKKKRRNGLRERLGLVTVGERAAWSEGIREWLLPLLPAEEWVAFMPLPTEPDITPLLLQVWLRGGEVVLPRVSGDDLVLHRVSAMEQLERKAFGILEPMEGLPVWEPGKGRTLCLVPGLGFDIHGHRLGRGRGFYDRMLSRWEGRFETVGVFFRCQNTGVIPCEPHDRALDRVVCESGWVDLRRP